jgi:two-component system, OmpR family, sensor histidine kinase VicK
LSITVTIIEDGQKELTQLLYGEENVMKAYTNFMDKAKARIDACLDSNGPSIDMGVKEYHDVLIHAIKTRGLRFRYLTEITKENISYCKELMKLVELRHLDGIKGDLSVTETEYMASAILQHAQPLVQVIYSNVKAIVEQQQYLFETLWNKAMPAEQKIEEIEQGREPEFFNVVVDPARAAEIYLDLSKSIEREALLLLPNSKAMIREYKLGIFENLAYASSERKAVVKIICPLDNENENIVKWLAEKSPAIQLINGKSSNSTMLIVDGKKQFVAELRKAESDTFVEAVGFAIYSNSRPTVNTVRSFFEMFWESRLLNEKLKETDRMQREFINIAAHELRTPTQAILGYSDLFYMKPESREEAIQVVARNALRLERLTNDILDVTKIEAQKLNLKKETFNLNELVQAALEDAKLQIANCDNIEFVSNFKQQDKILVDADKARITQVISNLVSNAIKFTKRGKISITTEVRADNQAIVSVQDTGTGIHDDIMPRLFTKFATKSQTGTGLGLFISKSIIEAHGGKIWAENNDDGKGATFTFTLPLAV